MTLLKIFLIEKNNLNNYCKYDKIQIILINLKIMAKISKYY